MFYQIEAEGAAVIVEEADVAQILGTYFQ